MQEKEEVLVVTTVTTSVAITHSGSIKQEEKKREVEKTEKDALIESDAHLQSGNEEGGKGKEKREGMPRKVCGGQERLREREREISDRGEKGNVCERVCVCVCVGMWCCS